MTAEVLINPRGIPRAPFVDKVEEFIGEGVEVTLKKFDELIAKYKFMENNTGERKLALEGKIPEIKKTLDMVELLIEKHDAEEEVEADFELNNHLYAKAKLKDYSNVYLWLGANVMLEYPLLEAQALLTEKLTTARLTLEQVTEDLQFLREQITTMEVNMARVYNYDVKSRKAKAGK